MEEDLSNEFLSNRQKVWRQKSVGDQKSVDKFIGNRVIEYLFMKRGDPWLYSSLLRRSTKG